jgi:hypothetical protein
MLPFVLLLGRLKYMAATPKHGYCYSFHVGKDMRVSRCAHERDCCKAFKGAKGAPYLENLGCCHRQRRKLSHPTVEVGQVVGLIPHLCRSKQVCQQWAQRWPAASADLDRREARCDS